MRKKIIIALQILFTGILLCYVLSKTGLLTSEGRKEISALLRSVNYIYLSFSLILIFILNFSSSIKWNMLLKKKTPDVSLFRTYCCYSIGKFFNLLLPSSVGGDIVRIMKMGEHVNDKAFVAASVLVERLTGLISLLVFAIFSVAFNFSYFSKQWLSLSLGGGVILITLILVLIVNESLFNLFRDAIDKYAVAFRGPFEKIKKMRKAILAYKSDKYSLIWAFINSVIFQLLSVLNVWISVKVFDDNVSFFTCLAFVPVILFIMNIPFSIGGIGLMEFAYIFTFDLFSIPMSVAFSTALLMRLKNILDALMGGAFYLFGILIAKEN